MEDDNARALIAESAARATAAERERARALLDEAGIIYREVPLP